MTVDMITSEMEAASSAMLVTATKTIVAATDGSEAGLSAFRAAALIRAHSGASVRVLNVVEPLPVFFPSPEGLMVPPDFDQTRENVQRELITEQLARFDSSGWTIDQRFGRAAETIVNFAHEQEASLIIVGANRHGLWDRVLGEETALEVARLTDTPLLVAASDMETLPSRVIVAMGLDPDGLQTAPSALSLLTDAPKILCAHVKPRSERLGIDWADLDSEYHDTMTDRFQTLGRQLSTIGMSSELVVLNGDTTRELVDFAAKSQAGLIVVGVRRRRGRARATGGRMAGRIIRAARSSVLIVPSTMLTFE